MFTGLKIILHILHSMLQKYITKRDSVTDSLCYIETVIIA